MFKTVKTKTSLLSLAVMGALSSFALAQEAGTDSGDISAEEYTTKLTDGLGTTFGSIMAVVIPIMLAITALMWFRKLRNKS